MFLDVATGGSGEHPGSRQGGSRFGLEGMDRTASGDLENRNPSGGLQARRRRTEESLIQNVKNNLRIIRDIHDFYKAKVVGKCILCNDYVIDEDTTATDRSKLCFECSVGFRELFGINSPSWTLPPLTRCLGRSVNKDVERKIKEREGLK